MYIKKILNKKESIIIVPSQFIKSILLKKLHIEKLEYINLHIIPVNEFIEELAYINLNDITILRREEILILTLKSLLNLSDSHPYFKYRFQSSFANSLCQSINDFVNTALIYENNLYKDNLKNFYDILLEFKKLKDSIKKYTFPEIIEKLKEKQKLKFYNFSNFIFYGFFDFTHIQKELLRLLSSHFRLIFVLNEKNKLNSFIENFGKVYTEPYPYKNSIKNLLDKFNYNLKFKCNLIDKSIRFLIYNRCTDETAGIIKNVMELKNKNATIAILTDDFNRKNKYITLLKSQNINPLSDIKDKFTTTICGRFLFLLTQPLPLNKIAFSELCTIYFKFLSRKENQSFPILSLMNKIPFSSDSTELSDNLTEFIKFCPPEQIHFYNTAQNLLQFINSYLIPFRTPVAEDKSQLKKLLKTIIEKFENSEMLSLEKSYLLNLFNQVFNMFDSHSNIMYAINILISNLKLPEFQSSSFANVVVSSLKNLGTLKFDYIVIPELIEGNFPYEKNEDLIFTPEIRNRLNNLLKNVEFSPGTVTTKMSLEFFRYALFSAKTLILSWHKLSNGNNPAFPSRVVNAILSAFNIPSEQIKELREDSELLTLMFKNIEIPLKFSKKLLQSSSFMSDEFYDYLSKNIKYSPSWNFMIGKFFKNDLTEFDGRISIEKLPDTLSASAIDTYIKCGFLFFVKYILKIEIEEEQFFEAGLTPLLRGNIIHKTLQMLFSRLKRKKAPSIDDIINSLPFTLEEVLKPYLNTKATKNIKPKVKQNLLTELKNFLLLLKNISKNRVILEIEKAFEKFKVFDNDSENLFNLCGRIDRIDRVNEKLINVIDYKTGKKIDKNLLSFQPLIYALWASTLYNTSPEDVTFSYYFLKEKKFEKTYSLLELKGHNNEKLNLLKNIFFSIKSGYIGRKHKRTNCEFCSLKLLCQLFYNEKLYPEFIEEINEAMF